MLFLIFTLLLGFGLLIFGGELLVRGAVRLAERAGISQLLIGLTIVGFGTSAPELVASLEAALRGSPGIAWGNVVGSNLANSLLILGVASLIMPIAVARGPLWRDGGLALAATASLYYCAYYGWINMSMGAAFIAVLVLYLIYAYISESKVKAPTKNLNPDLISMPVSNEDSNIVQKDILENKAKTAGYHGMGSGETAVGDKALALEISDTHLHDEQHWIRSAIVLISGIILIISGGRWLVSSAVELAAYFGMSEAVVGLTIIALGTSMPELITSIIAARKNASAVALGNILGSNLFNLLLIGGITAIVAPVSMPNALLSFGLPALLLSSVLLLIFAATKHSISRAEGAILLLLYVAQMLYNLWIL